MNTEQTPQTPMQQTIEGTEEPMKVVKQGALQSTIDPDVWYGTKGQEGFTHEDITRALEVLTDNSGSYFDWCDDYGEPGYSVAETGVVVLGDYWCHERYCPDVDNWQKPDPFDEGKSRFKLHGLEVHFTAEFKVLEDTECELEWHDEWVIEHGHSKAYRTQWDSYWWYPSTYMDYNGELCTRDDDVEDWIVATSSDPSGYVIPWQLFTADEYVSAGMHRWGPEEGYSSYVSRDDVVSEIEDHFEVRHGWDLDFIMVDSRNQGNWDAWYRVHEDG